MCVLCLSVPSLDIQPATVQVTGNIGGLLVNVWTTDIMGAVGINLQLLHQQVEARVLFSGLDGHSIVVFPKAVRRPQNHLCCSTTPFRLIL